MQFSQFTFQKIYFIISVIKKSQKGDSVMKKLNLAIIGQGRSGKDIHGKYYRSEDNQYYTVKYVVDADEFRRGVAEEIYPGCKTFANYEELFALDDIDIVVNASYSEMHYSITKDLLLHRICRATLTLLCKLRILRRGPEKQLKLDAAMENYRTHIHLLRGRGKGGMMLKVFLFNFFQRSAQIAVTAFTFLATGGDPAKAFSLWTLQGYVVLGSNSIPIPGAMGVSDYIMLDGFRSIMSESAAVNLEILSRSFSFYICILICGISTLVYYQVLKKRRKP